MVDILGQRCPLHILIAEDNQLNWRILQRILKKLGYDSKVVENGLDAVDATEAALAEARPYDLILMDIQMPKMDGITATQEIFSRLPIDQHPQVVIVTANATSEYIEICQKIGTHSLVTKPIDKQRIADALERCYQDMHRHT
jgi:CheY-like chemotaxis protein